MSLFNDWVLSAAQTNSAVDVPGVSASAGSVNKDAPLAEVLSQPFTAQGQAGAHGGTATSQPVVESTGKRPRPSIEAPEPVKRARSKGKEAEASTHNGNTDTFKRCTPANSKQSPEAQLAMFRGQGGELRGRELVDRLKVLRALREARTQLREDPVLFPLLYPIIQALEKCDADWVITL